MTSAATVLANGDDRLTLHGVTHSEIADVIGQSGAEFAGTRVWPIVEGAVAGLVSREPPPSRWQLPTWLKLARTPNSSPVLSALASLFPIVPLEPGTRFVAEEPLRKMLASRGPELDEIVLSHSGFLQCDVRAEFDADEAEYDVASNSPVGALRATTGPEFVLVRRALTQSVTGRRASFVARLRRCLTDVAADLMIPDEIPETAGLARRVLLARSSRKAFRDSISELAQNAGSGARLTIGPFMPPLSFRKIEVRGADIGAVSAARAALGLGDSADRIAIRIAYRRTLERFAPIAGGEREDDVARLGNQFGLLDLVAEGQIRSAQGSSAMNVRFDPKSLSETWLLKLHLHDVADRVA